MQVRLPMGQDMLLWCRVLRMPSINHKHHVVKVSSLLQVYNPFTVARARPPLSDLIKAKVDALVMPKKLHVEFADLPLPSPFLIRERYSSASRVFASRNASSSSRPINMPRKMIIQRLYDILHRVINHSRDDGFLF